MYASLLCCICLVLVSCDSIKTYKVKPKPQQKLAIQQWKMQGRLSIKSDHVLTANIQWQHKQQQDILRLSGVLGFGAVLIELNEHEIILYNTQGERQSAQDIDAFIARKIGFVVPITALRQWIVGAYLQAVPVEYLENGFQQLGWHVAYNRYRDVHGGVLPHYIEVKKDNIKLKLIVDRWEIE